MKKLKKIFGTEPLILDKHKQMRSEFRYSQFCVKVLIRVVRKRSPFSAKIYCNCTCIIKKCWVRKIFDEIYSGISDQTPSIRKVFVVSFTKHNIIINSYDYLYYMDFHKRVVIYVSPELFWVKGNRGRLG